MYTAQPTKPPMQQQYQPPQGSQWPPMPLPPVALRQTKPFYKKMWFIILVALLVLMGIGRLAGGPPSPSPRALPTAGAVHTATQEAAQPTEGTTIEEESPAPEEATAQASEPTPEATGGGDWSGLTAAADSISACERYGKQMYPLGFKIHVVTGKISETPSDDGLTLVYKATVTQRVGGKYDGTVECTVGGDPKNPTVQEFFFH